MQQNILNKSALNFFKTKYQEFDIPVPKIHFVLGSLLGSSLELVSKQFPFWERRGRITFAEVEGVRVPSAPSHRGYYEYFYHKEKNKALCFQSGRLHGYEGLRASQVVQTVVAPCWAGTKHFVLSNISGALRKDLPVGSVVALKDHINFTGQSPLTGLSKEKDFYFVDMSGAYNREMTKALSEKMEEKKLQVFSGVYVGVLGPQFETPAEVQLFADWRADVVGMSTIWEVIALHYLKAKLSAFSFVTNPAAGMGDSVDIDFSSLKPGFSKLLESFFCFADSF